LLWARRLRDPAAARAFLEPGPEASPDPFAFAEMDEAIRRIERVIAEGGAILVHGDYDVDGLCGTAVLYRYLVGLGLRVFRFVPNRRVDGYGFSERAARWAIEHRVSLVIAVDCGTSDGERIAELEAAGIPVVVCDHHEFPLARPTAGTIVNPVRPGEPYPFRHLCGTGVAFKLVQALAHRGIRGRVAPDELLDLVALATVGDVSPLIGENRYLVREGLERLNRDPRPGIRALLHRSRLGLQKLSAWHLSWVLSPRLNAPGRVALAKPALELLCTDDEEEARRLAEELERTNDHRRDLSEQVLQQALGWLEALPVAERQRLPGVFLLNETWDEGVLGIAAARLAQRLGRPALLATATDGVVKGSGRSVPGVDLKGGLDRCREHLVRYGGHEQAVGFTLTMESVPRFREALMDVLEEATRTLPSKPPLAIDAEIRLEECRPELVDFLDRLEPFGFGNREPLWLLRGVALADAPWSVGRGHLKIRFVDGEGYHAEAIYFDAPRDTDPPRAGEPVDLVVQLRRDTYRGEGAVELRIQDWRRHRMP
jgi:single-stranded-DNA-specific exonuclease